MAGHRGPDRPAVARGRLLGHRREVGVKEGRGQARVVVVAKHPGTRKLYADKLTAQGLGETLGDDMVKSYRAALDAGQEL